MALSASKARQALVAFHRFGLGAKPGVFAKVAKDPKAALIGELAKPGIAKITSKKLPAYGKACSDSQKDFSKSEDLRLMEINARIAKHMSVQVGFVERLVLFWSNHFSMSVNKSGAVRGTLGQLERDVIRKHVLGNFSDMLIGVLRHPAMISFLDNEDSVGPNSQYGSQTGSGFNENLAREVLELHTLGSGGGYTEADVSAFALILTGWSYVRGWEADNNYNGGNKHNRGRYIFRKTWHEPGAITLMGKRYPAEWDKQAVRALRDLARKPATAEHIAFKLVRHFITDEPTPQMVEPLKQAYLSSGGNLRKVARALIELPEAFSAPLTRLRTPYELAIAQYRALGHSYPKDNYWWLFAGPLYALNNMPWECPSPEGYADETLHWLDPDGMTLRLDTARLFGWVYGDKFRGNVSKLARDLFDKAMSRETAERIAAGGDKRNALTLLFCCPEFHRR